MDITEVILFQHHQQRRMFAALDELDRGDATGLAAVWAQLARFLEVHATAEERYFYPEVLKVGHGAGGAHSAADETEDAIGDHNDIRDAIARAGEHETGSEDWWQAVIEARLANSDHMAEEEREDLADFRQHASLQLRHDVAVRFLVFEAQHADGVQPHDLNPGEYVATGGASSSEE
ncbi:MAG: hemerythrin domain-containing protein [Kineosporiaceae bacterium]|nr:hemerythrin domain-containing protein [Aeromicrobium sp.]